MKTESKTFDEIKRIVIKYGLNNNGFKVRDILNRNEILNTNTIENFIPKHARLQVKYFERIGEIGSGLYKIRPEFLNKK